MNELLIILAEAMPEEMLLKELRKELDNYEANPTKETKGKLGLICQIWLSKDLAEEMGGSEALIKRTNIAKQGFDLLNTSAT